MSAWRILFCILFATSVHAALPIAPDHGPLAPQLRADWRGADDWRRNTSFTGAKGSDQRSRLIRHRTYMIEGVPEGYQGAASPVRRSRNAIMAGAALYTQHCSACHGRKGRGGGDAGLTLKPTPALKTYISRRPWAADEYLLWSVAEGGVEFGSTMPAFREQLTREQMWQIIAYMRAGFPRGENDK
jgi:mono/diheme cytochrome c family protein